MKVCHIFVVVVIAICVADAKKPAESKKPAAQKPPPAAKPAPESQKPPPAAKPDESGCTKDLQASRSQLQSLEDQLKQAQEQLKKSQESESQLKKQAQEQLKKSQESESQLKKQAQEQLKKSQESESQLKKQGQEQLKKSQESESQLKTQGQEQLKKSQDSEAQLKQLLDEEVKLRSISKPISLVDLGAQVGGLTSHMLQHCLKSTDWDDKILQHVSTHAATAKDVTVDLTSKIIDQVSAINYAEYYAQLSSSDIMQQVASKTDPYVEKMRPALEKVRPALEKVRPALTMAQDMASRASENAQPFVDKVAKFSQPHVERARMTVTSTYENHVVPKFKEGGAKALSSSGQWLDSRLSPVFDFIGEVAPAYKDILPQHFVDRILFIIMFGTFALYSLYLGRFCLKASLKILKKSSWMSFQLFRVCVMLPLRITLRLISWLFWFATGFYCCGLCKSKKKAMRLKEKQNGTAQSKESSNGENVSVDEAAKILESAKKGNTLKKGLDVLANVVKTGTPMKKPDFVKGKKLTKEVLLQACKKLSVDASGLKL